MRRLIATIALIAGTWSAGLAREPVKDFGVAVRKFSAERHKLARHLSSRLDLPLPEQAEAFFRAAETGPWESVSNRFVQVKGIGEYGKAIHGLRNELWAPIHEALGIWEVWVGWKEDSSLLAMFHEPVLSSMPKGSIFFGGTDYGRFVITTVNALQDTQTVFTITQNALADPTYAAHLRAIYGDKIWLPEKEDSARAFQQYVEDVQSGKRPANAELEIKDGRVQVSGAMGVMEINGIICQMIFENNKADHDFFVEESYVLNWMYPHLEPHGLIMKLNRQTLGRLPEATVTRDREFWKSHEQRLQGIPGFAGNSEARKAFSKLRCAIASIYAYRRMYAEAEEAFEQAIRLCPGSPEASYRLADTQARQGQTERAVGTMRNFLRHAPPDQRDGALKYIRQLEERMREKK